MEVSDWFVNCFCVGNGDAMNPFNIETGNYYSKSIFIMTLIKHEKLGFILVILYIQEYLCVLTKLSTGTRVSEDFQFWVSGSRNNRKRTALVPITGIQWTIQSKNQASVHRFKKKKNIKKVTYPPICNIVSSLLLFHLFSIIVLLSSPVSVCLSVSYVYVCINNLVNLHRNDSMCKIENKFENSAK